jgi:hypothetical protein
MQAGGFVAGSILLNGPIAAFAGRPAGVRPAFGTD